RRGRVREPQDRRELAGAVMRVGVVGAGVSGLTCARVLSEEGADVTIFARETEGEASPVAAAIWYPYHIGGPPEKVERWAWQSRETFEELARVPRTRVAKGHFDILD